MKITFLGAGAWGTALASLLSENGHETMLWAFEPDVADAINGAQENPRFLPGILLHPELRAATDNADSVVDFFFDKQPMLGSILVMLPR